MKLFKRKVSLEQIRAIVIPLMIFFNLYGKFFENTANVSRQLFLVFPVVLALFYYIHHIIHINVSCLKYTGLTVAICLFQVGIIHNLSGVTQQCVYVLALMLASSIFSYKYDKFIFNQILLISVLMVFESLYYYLMLLLNHWNTFNTRTFTSAPKEDYTLVLSIAFVLAFSRYLYEKDKRERLFYIILMGIELFGSIIIMQSKTAIIILIVVFIVAFQHTTLKNKKRLLGMGIILLIALLLIMNFGQNYIPDFVYIFINRYTGLFSGQVSSLSNYNIYVGTYDTRAAINQLSFELWKEHPLFGIGFGEYEKHALGTAVSGINQAESGMIGAFANGGTFYGIGFFIFLAFPIIKAIKLQNAENKNKTTEIMLVAVVVFLCSLSNDCDSITFWTIMGIIYSQLFYIKKGLTNDFQDKNIVRDI